MALLTKIITGRGEAPTFGRRYAIVLPVVAILAWGLFLAAGDVPATTGDRADLTEQTAERVALAQNEYRQAHQALQSAQSRVAAARERMEAFLDGHFAEHRRAAEQAPAAEQPTAPPRPQTRMAPNPQRQQLAARLAEMVGEREQLLERFMPAHPIVRDRDERIAELQAQHDRLPEFVAVTEGALEADDHRATTSDAGETFPPAEDARLQHAEAARAFEQARQELIAAEQAAEQTRLAERRALREQQSAVESHQAALAAQRTVEPARAGGWPVLLLAGALAVMAGAAMAMATAELRLVFQSAAEIQAALPLAVIGVLPGGEVVGGLSPQISRPVVWGVLAAEVGLAVFASAVVALSIQNPAFPVQLLEAPLEMLLAGLEILL